MSWASPIYLNFLIIAPLIAVFFVFVSIKRRKLLDVFGEKAIVEKLYASKNFASERLKRALIVLAVFFLIISLARPQMGSKLTMTQRYGVDVMIAVDTSLSMITQDVKPSRIEKAKIELDSFIDRLKGDRVGIITFAGDSFVQCPLTLDYSAAKMFLSVVEPGMMPRPGTAIGDAITTAIGSFIKKQRKYKVLVLLTDGENHDDNPLKAAEEARKQGIIIYTIGIGTAKGEPIPIIGKDGTVSGYKKDKSGQVVMSRLDESMLRRIALATGGRYYMATAGESELDKIYDEISKMEKRELSNRLFTEKEDRFQYFLGMALLLLFAEFFIGDRKNA